MNDTILAEFIARYPEDSEILFKKLQDLENEFVMIREVDEYDEDEFGTRLEWVRVYGMIYTQTASMIKLRDPFLAERMRISYIPDTLKDAYRR